MSRGEVRLEREGAVATLTFDREAARNSMTWKMYDELHDACVELRDDRDVRVVVLRGQGDRAFVAGTDIGQFAEFRTGDDGIAYEERVERVLEQLEQLPQATVAVIQGYAVGGGLMIAAVCDLRVSSTTGRFGLPVARTLGNCLSAKGYARLVNAFGPVRTKELVFTARFMDAKEANNVGFVSAVHGPEELDAEVRQLADTLTSHAPLTMWATKEAIRRLTVATLPDCDDIVHRVYRSDDFQEGYAAFLDKRQAEWRGA